MIINGFIYLFDICVFNQNEAVKRIAVCSSIEEAVVEVDKYYPNLKEDEYIDINPCLVGGIDYSSEPILNCATSISGFGTPKDNGQTVDEFCKMVIDELTMETPPEYPDHCYPKKKKIIYPKGTKKIPLSQSVFYDDYYRAIRGEKKKQMNSERNLTIIPEDQYDRLICPQCWENVKNCECAEWPEEFYQIDSMISEAVANLNRKGYFTSNCCEGHDWTNSEAYVAFLAYYDFDVPIPKGWEQWGGRIYCQYNLNLVGKESFDEVKRRMLNALTEWTRALKTLDEAFT